MQPLSPPDNNVHLPHPILGVGHMVSMGMHIEPVNNPLISGHKVMRVEKGKIADKVNLR